MEYKMILIIGYELVHGHKIGEIKDYSKLKWEIEELIEMPIYAFLILHYKFIKLNTNFINFLF